MNAEIHREKKQNMIDILNTTKELGFLDKLDRLIEGQNISKLSVLCRHVDDFIEGGHKHMREIIHVELTLRVLEICAPLFDIEFLSYGVWKACKAFATHIKYGSQSGGMPVFESNLRENIKQFCLQQNRETGEQLEEKNTSASR